MADADHVGVLLTPGRNTAIEHRPALLLATLARPPAALMVAPG